MYHFKVDDVDTERYEAFIRESQYCNMMQSEKWKKVKRTWGAHMAVVTKEGGIVAACLILVRPLPLKKTMLYLPRGPVMDFLNEELVRFFFAALKDWAKKQRSIFIKADPGVLRRSAVPSEGNGRRIGAGSYQDNPDYETVMRIFRSAGLMHCGFESDMSATIQPRIHMEVSRDTFCVEHFTKKGRKNYRTSLKKNLEIEVCRGAPNPLLEDFAAVMQCTMKRKGIAVRDKAYYQLLLETFGTDCVITLVYLDLEKTRREVLERYEACQQELERCADTMPKKKHQLKEQMDSLTTEKMQLQEMQNLYGSRACAAGTLTVLYGSRAETLYAGMDEAFKRYMASYLAWYATFEDCFARGCDTVNMGGVEGDLHGGLSDFKLAFSPKICEYIGEFDLPVSRLWYGPFMFAYKKMKSISIHHPLRKWIGRH